MSAGMAEVIAAVLAKHASYVRNEDAGGVICGECGWEVASKLHAVESTTVRMGQHEAQMIAEELTKAGYGLADPLAAARADPEGRALVQAIHDRKAASNGN